MFACSTSKSYFHHVLLKEKVSALVASDAKDSPIGYMPSEPGSPLYVMRRLTPKECARCQGFRDDWCEGLEQEEPTEAEVAFFQAVWDEWCDMQGLKRKTGKQVREWLRKTPTDSAQYKMWGNGVTLPVVSFIMERIAQANEGVLDEQI